MSRALKKFFPPQFRLVTLLALIAVISVPLAIYASWEHQFRLRRAAVLLLNDAGDMVLVDKNRYPGADDPLRRDEVVISISAGPRLTEAEVSAIVCFPTLQELELASGGLYPAGGFSEYECTQFDGQLQRIAKLPLLEKLDLEGTPVTDQGLRHLAALRKLEALELLHTRVTDEGLRHLAGLPRLRELGLAETRVSGRALALLPTIAQLDSLSLRGDDIADDSLQHLLRVPMLQVLILERTRVSDDGLRILTRCDAVQHLDVSYCPGVSDEGLKALPLLKSLESVDLSGTRLSDEGLKALQRCRSLKSIHLSDCRGVSDAGLAHLGRIPLLRGVHLDGTAVTEGGARRLHEVLPHALIAWGSIDDRMLIYADDPSVDTSFHAVRPKN